MTLIVGLGNPDPEYTNTFHNAGVLAVDSLAGGPTGWKTAPHFSYRKDGRTILVKPTTFMNDSGKAVRAALSYFKLLPEALIVLHDDADIPLGETRFVFARGAAGHHGIESIIKELGTNAFWRLRIGVRTGKGKAGSFVLRPMSHTDEQAFYGAIEGLKEKLATKEKP